MQAASAPARFAFVRIHRNSNEAPPPRRRELTPTEMRVVRLLCHREGATLAEVAEVLDIEPTTAGVHLQRAYKKLKVKNRIQLYALAVELGWVKCTCGHGA